MGIIDMAKINFIAKAKGGAPTREQRNYQTFGRLFVSKFLDKDPQKSEEKQKEIHSLFGGGGMSGFTGVGVRGKKEGEFIEIMEEVTLKPGERLRLVPSRRITGLGRPYFLQVEVK